MPAVRGGGSARHKGGETPAQRVSDSAERDEVHLGVHQEDIGHCLLTHGLPGQGLRCRQSLYPRCLAIQKYLLIWCTRLPWFRTLVPNTANTLHHLCTHQITFSSLPAASNVCLCVHLQACARKRTGHIPCSPSSSRGDRSLSN